MAKKEYSEEIQRLLKEVVDHFDNEDIAVRQKQIRTYRRLKLMWEGFQRVYYSEVAHDWRIWDTSQEQSDSEQSYYDKPINVFRAYLESIIAALSVTVPPIKCYPDDADNPLDIMTARAGDKIAELNYRHNDAPLLWLHALFIYCTEGMIAAYSYPKSDEAYGTYKQDEHDQVTENHQITTCPLCGYQVEDKVVEAFDDLEKDEFAPDNDDVQLHSALNQGLDVCPACAQLMDPEIANTPLIVTRLVGTTTLPKTRMCIEVYGGLYVKVALYAMKQADTPYLNFDYETHYSNIIERYPHLYDKLHGGDGRSGSSGGGNTIYEQQARLSPQYQGQFPNNVRTVRNRWLRPLAFNVLKKEDSDRLKKEFPDGAKVVLINEDFAEACNESLDDCWTLSVNPLSDYIQHDPLGLLLTSVQEITNDLVSLTLQTIEHGIPQTFADPSVLNFKAYRQTEATPGNIYQAVAKSGKSVGDGFFQTKTSTLSGEVLPFGQNIQQLGQLASGAQPSLFGGQMDTGSKTASEYSMARAQSLQRLQTTWKMLTMWWKNVYGKVIPSQIKEMESDERHVERDTFGNFINTFIRKAELEGKIGRVELEANENLPITWNQQRDVIMQLIQTGNPEILAIVGSPENLPVIREIIGLVDLFVPGEDDRNKQYDEIKQLTDSTPITQPPAISPQEVQQNPQLLMTPGLGAQLQPTEVPSVEIDPDIDNHAIEFEICKKWLVSPAGQLCKTDNPDGYKNVLLHAKQHQQAMMMQMAPAVPNGAAQPSKPPNETGAPIKEPSDAPTVN